ncbi:MAG TPA: DUF1272 domain-containing protein [Thermoanaerobaculia bacterium]|nr:DUF1272 domain-containing protein [Thermoanaerobaculia bacterium]
MLEQRPGCECCDRDLAPDGDQAWICSFECTFCEACARERLRLRCPNCGGELTRRPARPAGLLVRYPASSRRVHRPSGCASGEDVRA